jgi:L-serine dehydratase
MHHKTHCKHCKTVCQYDNLSIFGFFMNRENIPILEIFGPVMIGPSSSHTAGVARIAFLARKMFAVVPEKVKITFHGSIAATWKGHGSADAAAAGLLGLSLEDGRLNRGMEILKKSCSHGQGFSLEVVSAAELPPLWHPNTLIIEMFSRIRPPLKVRAASIGGGSIRINEINGYGVDLSGELHAILVLHHDEIGVIAVVSRLLAVANINIASISSHRKGRKDDAFLVVEADGHFPSEVIGQINALPPVYNVIRVPALTGQEAYEI